MTDVARSSGAETGLPDDRGRIHLLNSTFGERSGIEALPLTEWLGPVLASLDDSCVR